MGVNSSSVLKSPRPCTKDVHELLNLGRRDVEIAALLDLVSYYWDLMKRVDKDKLNQSSIETRSCRNLPSGPDFNCEEIWESKLLQLQTKSQSLQGESKHQQDKASRIKTWIKHRELVRLAFGPEEQLRFSKLRNADEWSRSPLTCLVSWLSFCQDPRSREEQSSSSEERRDRAVEVLGSKRPLKYAETSSKRQHLTSHVASRQDDGIRESPAPVDVQNCNHEQPFDTTFTSSTLSDHTHDFIFIPPPGDNPTEFTTGRPVLNPENDPHKGRVLRFIGKENIGKDTIMKYQWWGFAGISAIENDQSGIGDGNWMMFNLCLEKLPFKGLTASIQQTKVWKDERAKGIPPRHTRCLVLRLPTSSQHAYCRLDCIIPTESVRHFEGLQFIENPQASATST